MTKNQNPLIVCLAVLFLIVLFAASGCIKPVAKLGCCLRENISEGCVLYNTTDLQEYDHIGDTNGECDDNATGTAGHCNVTIGPGSTWYLIPICTQDQLVSCIAPNCTAMVCGDFSYTPRVAPGFSSVDDAKKDIPPDTNDQAVTEFYKAQCRFIPMNAKLRQIMKNSKSEINVFRAGVGGSFDEFEQYRYFLPVSDQYCNINPPKAPGDLRVDRYMNYLAIENAPVDGSSGGEWEDSITAVAYDPLDSTNGITENCINDTDAPPPMGYTEDTTTHTSEFDVPHDDLTASYTPVTPDKSSYLVAHHGIYDKWANWVSTNGGYFQYSEEFFSPSSLYKEIDQEFYRKQLAIAHAATIYGLGGSGTGTGTGTGGAGTGTGIGQTTRAPFECNIAGMDCYSGSCDTSVYSRGVLLEAETTGAGMGGEAEGSESGSSAGSGSLGSDNAREIIADCNKIFDANGLERVVCAPTKSVAVSSTPGVAPKLTYASVDVVPIHIESNSNPSHTFEDFAEDKTILNGLWTGFNNSGFAEHSTVGALRTMTNAAGTLRFYWAEKKDCPWDYGESSSSQSVLCSEVTEAEEDPPLGGAVFFGKVGEDATVTYNGEVIIGYAIASPTEFQNMMVVKNCDLDMTNTATFPHVPAAGDDPFSCIQDCMDICSEAVGTSTVFDKCNNYCGGHASQPCTPSFVNTTDFVRVSVGTPTSTSWQKLMTAFTPYFEQTVGGITSKGFSDGCGKKINSYDPIITAMPWVLNHDKGIRLEGAFDTSEVVEFNYMTSPVAQSIRERNIYDEAMDTGRRDTSSCELRRAQLPWEMPYLLPTIDKRPYYDLLVSKNIYLFKYKPGSGKLGTCAVDDSTYLPKVKTFGWCNPCTASTLAYQKVSATSKVYLPEYTAQIEPGSSQNLESICEAQYDYGWSWESGGMTATDNVSCYNQHITDIDEYSGSIGAVGSPRTIPEASVLKKRIGDYMKSGVMPVLDLSNDTNWDLNSPYYDENPGFGLFYFQDLFGTTSEEYYLQYDFERLFGNMGALVVIVDSIDGEASPAQAQRIIDRSEAIRTKCPTCLVAFNVENPATNASFRQSMDSVFDYDPFASYSIDLVTFGYKISDHSSVISSTGENLSEDLATYGRAALQSRGKPTMVVGLNLQNYPGYTTAQYEKLMMDIAVGQDKLVKAGVIGIIYAPARTAVSSGPGSEGIVNVDMLGAGHKEEKFCALEKVLERMTASPSIAIYTKAPAVESPTCVECTSLDQLQHTCDTMCEDGAECTMPEGVGGSGTSGGYKCPTNTIAEPCQLCSEVGGSYSCDISYANGTVVTIGGAMSDVTSDIYMDIIAGIPKPDKCCLEDSATGTRYTYVKQSFSNQLNKPIVFPKNGDPDADCGVGSDTEAVAGLSSFCGMKATPIKEYDITCRVS